MASVNFFLISRTQQQSEICKSCVARCTFWKYWKYITKVQLERRAQARRSLRRRRRNFWDSWASVALFVSSFFFLFLPLAPPNDHVFWNSHLECGNEGQIAVVMLTKGNSGAVNGLVTCICRSLAGNMEQHGAEVEILQKKLPQILWEFWSKIRRRIQIHILIHIFDILDQHMTHGPHVGEVCTRNSQWLLRTSQ